MGKEGQIQRAGSRSKAGDTSPPRGESEVPPYALESLRMLQVREHLADERKDHACFYSSGVPFPGMFQAWMVAAERVTSALRRKLLPQRRNSLESAQA
jgi:hypothetical protein